MKITSKEQLSELYGTPNERAKNKILLKLEKHSRNFIERSPFFILSTIDQQGKMDSSPRGGKPGFVKILNDNQIIFPDSKGNNRVDSLSNIVDTGRVGTLFLIPGVDETLRINGSAHISSDPKLIELFPDEKNTPKTCVVIEVEEVFLHCAKAFMRSALWSADSKIERSELPSIGEMLRDQLGSKEVPESQEAMLKRYQDDL